MRHNTLKHLPVVALAAFLTVIFGCGAPPAIDDPVIDSNNDPDTTSLNTASVSFNFEEDADPVVADLPFAADELIAKITPGATNADLQSTYNDLGATVIENITEIQSTVLRVSPDRRDEIARTISTDPLFESVHKNYFYDLQARPNDANFNRQSHLTIINAQSAWDTVTGDESVLIAVLDTGIEPTHPDLEDKLTAGYNAFDDNNDTADVFGHGTAVAGTVAAITDNRIGVSGVAWDNPILPVRISDSRGRAAARTIAKSIIYATDRGAKVINISFAPIAADRTIQAATQYAFANGAIVVIASGNNGRALKSRGYETALFIGATQNARSLAEFSNTGPFMDLVAPGVDIRTTLIDESYGLISGTSFSSPIVAGVAALVISANPDLRPSTIQQILLDTAGDLGVRGWDDAFGNGMVNAAAAVQQATEIIEEEDDESPEVDFLSPDNNESVSGKITVSVEAFDRFDIADVVLSIDGVPFATDTAKNYRFVVNTKDLSNGTHTLTAVATDQSGNASDPASIRIRVEGSRVDSGNGSNGSGSDNDNPVVVINFPVQGSTVVSSVGVQATVTDNNNLATIEWLVDGSRKETTSVSGTRAVESFVWDASNARRGTHTITVRATDRAGNQTSQSVRLVKE